MHNKEKFDMGDGKRDAVLIYGCGTMGCGIACCAVLAGEQVILFHTNEEKARKAVDRVKEVLEEMRGQGLCGEPEVSQAARRVGATGDLESVCGRIKVVFESVYENLPLKQDVFARLDALLPPEVPILSNTSGMRITEIAAKTLHPERTLTTHFWLPANLIPLVEVVIGEKSSPALAEEIKTYLAGWGKKPVIVARDLPGQLANRILQAIIREAINIVEIGLASPEDVDQAIKMGMALRFPVWGPLEHVDAVGFDICESVQNTVLPEISSRKAASPLFEKMRSEGHTGYKTGKGFYDWSKKDMDALVKKRNDFIIHALKKI
jgi:3-hydroxybutyryl-CoA dehydrogenase